VPRGFDPRCQASFTSSRLSSVLYIRGAAPQTSPLARGAEEPNAVAIDSQTVKASGDAAQDTVWVRRQRDDLGPSLVNQDRCAFVCRMPCATLGSCI